jgi:acetolactate synthase-1/2/3 large subunit
MDGKINIVTMHHEQAAAFAAEGYARQTGKPGVALATSGPGATNLLTGIASCYFDSVPAVFITGQVNTNEQKGDRSIRQLGFQETDIVSMSKVITKRSYAIKSADEIPSILKESFELASSGRPGPVLIDIPMDIQREHIDENLIDDTINSNSVDHHFPNEILELTKAIKAAERPLILAGRGINASGCRSIFNQFVELTGIPVVFSLHAVDLLSHDHSQRVGMIGSYGNRWANLAVSESDLLIVLGSRLDIRQTGADVAAFSSTKTIFHLDIEKGEINNRIEGCYSINSDLKSFLQSFNSNFSSNEANRFVEWMKKIIQEKFNFPDTAELKNCIGINPNMFMKLLSAQSYKAAAFFADVGSHQMWAAQSLKLNSDQRFHTSGGMGAMGFALPAAIGGCIASKRMVVSISGDGGFQLNMQELQTILRNNLPIKIVVINNNSLGMIRQFQDSYFDGRHQSTVWGYSAPDFCKIANAYGINSYRIESGDDIQNGIQKLWAGDSAFLLEVTVDKSTNVYPKIAFGKPITEMEPFSKPVEMEGT